MDGDQNWKQAVVVNSVYALDTGNDGDRVTGYVGSSEGVVQLVDNQMSRVDSIIPGKGSLKGDGVHRMTSRQPDKWLYFPFISKK